MPVPPAIKHRQQVDPFESLGLDRNTFKLRTVPVGDRQFLNVGVNRTSLTNALLEFLQSSDSATRAAAFPGLNTEQDFGRLKPVSGALMEQNVRTLSAIKPFADFTLPEGVHQGLVTTRGGGPGNKAVGRIAHSASEFTTPISSSEDLLFDQFSTFENPNQRIGTITGFHEDGRPKFLGGPLQGQKAGERIFGRPTSQVVIPRFNVQTSQGAIGRNITEFLRPGGESERFSAEVEAEDLQGFLIPNTNLSQGVFADKRGVAGENILIGSIPESGSISPASLNETLIRSRFRGPARP
jgi:hypothetical protein